MWLSESQDADISSIYVTTPSTEKLSATVESKYFAHPNDDDEICDEVLQGSYRILSVKWAYESKIFESQKRKFV